MRKTGGVVYLHLVENFEERERHAAAYDHLVHLVQHALDELDLVSHLRSDTQHHALNGMSRCYRNSHAIRHQRSVTCMPHCHHLHRSQLRPVLDLATLEGCKAEFI